MKQISEVESYLVNHWRTYEEMQLVEEEINRYLASLAPRIQLALRESRSFPRDWEVKLVDVSDEGIYIHARPKSWIVAGRLPDQAYIEFGGLEASQLLTADRDYRSWIALVSEYDRRKRFPKRQKWCKALREICEKPDSLTENLEYAEDPREYAGAILYQSLDSPLPLRILEDDEMLVKYVVEMILPLVKYVEKLRKANPKLG